MTKLFKQSREVGIESMSGAPVGNQNAKNAKRWQSAVTRALARLSSGAGVEAGLDQLADKLVQAAALGEQWALREIGDRLDGKPAQAMTVSGDPDAPLHAITEIVSRGVLPPNAG